MSTSPQTPKPSKSRKPPAVLTPAALKALVTQWDQARTELAAAGDQVAALQLQLQGLDGSEPAERRNELDALLVTARQRLAAAHERIAALQPVPEGAKLPAAKGPAPVRAPTPKEEKKPQQDRADADRIAITVIGPARGRRRAGHVFDATPRTIHVSAAEKVLIEADPGLAVTEGALPPAGDMDRLRQRLAEADFAFAGDNATIKVLGPARTRRRAGFTFGPAAQTVAVSRSQLAAILGDESLAVTPA